MEFIKAKSNAELEVLFPIVQELREYLQFDEYMEIVRDAEKRDDYELIGVFEEKKCIGIIGTRILSDFVHGRHLYVDDLIVTKAHQSKGLGPKLLDLAKERAQNLNCKGLRLCTGVENKDGIRFYEREGWTARALAFKKQLH